jgi:hypothetical protein
MSDEQYSLLWIVSLLNDNANTYTPIIWIKGDSFSTVDLRIDCEPQNSPTQHLHFIESKLKTKEVQWPAQRSLS